MTFLVLPSPLHSTAAAAEEYFRQRGARAFKYETPLHPDLELRPTLTATLADKSILCVDVSTKAYNNSLDRFVLDAFTGNWPIHLYVAIPDTKDPDFGTNLRRAKKNGVGVILLQDGVQPTVYAKAVSLSLLGLTKTDLKEFPARVRPAIVEAEETFRDGNPNKGCQAMFEELEDITRRCAIATQKKGYWRAPKPGETPPPKHLDKDAWAPVLESMETYLEFKNVPNSPKLTKALVAATRGQTDPRNQTSHKPKDLAARKKRDRRLREWFEQGRELLFRWHDATRTMKL